jgi:uncharacterized protein YbbC (DUF1343 family)
LILAALPLAAGVEIGLERLQAEGGGALRGRRVGLVASVASVTRGGQPAAEVLRGAGVVVVRIFAPEHGYHANGAAGEPVPDEPPGAGPPIVSLYGPRTSPEPTQLADLDALVVDLQDAGVRFYTYSATLLRCLAACATAGVPLVVLDRPNPLGGDALEGPLAEGSGADRAPGPLRHGLTLGEIARFANARRAHPARLSVVAMSGWRRAMTWPRTGRPWVAPSPNLRTAEAVLVYPGTALLEATNVSEGRGTPRPFLLFGAPWLDAAGLVRELSAAGLRFRPEPFVPEASPVAPTPKYAGSRCAGVRIDVDGAVERPYAFGLGLLARLLRRQPELEITTRLDDLLGAPHVRARLNRGVPAPEILAADAAAIDAFRRERASALLY